MNNVIPPTKKQKEILDYIQGFIKEKGYSPSYREIAEALKYDSHSTVAMHIQNLIKRGHLSARSNASRSLEVTSMSGEEQALITRVQDAFDKVEHPISKDEFVKLAAMVDGLEAFGLEEQAGKFSRELRALIKDVL